MKLRIYRKSKWVLACSASEVRLGGRNPMKLEHTDVLQVCHGEDVWEDVPVVSEPPPEHPQDAKDRRADEIRGDALERSVARAMSRKGPG